MNVDLSPNTIEMSAQSETEYISIQSNMKQISFGEIQNISLIGKGNFSEVYKGYLLGTPVVSSII
jgi:hypothetical protein